MTDDELSQKVSALVGRLDIALWELQMEDDTAAHMQITQFPTDVASPTLYERLLASDPEIDCD